MENTGVKEIFSKDFVTIVKEMRRDKKQTAQESWAKAKIALLGTGSLQFFSEMLKYYLFKSQIRAEILVGTYKGTELDVMDSESEYNKFHPDITVIFSDYRDIICDFDMKVSEDEVWEKVWDEITRYEILWDKIKSQTGSYILQTNIVTPIERKHGNLEANYIWSKQTFLELLNFGLEKKKKQFVTILDFNYLAALKGKEKWFDFSNYYLNKCNMSYECIPFAVEEVALNVLNYCGKCKKCLVLDLDNTLWGGVLEERGTEGIDLSPNDAVGEAFLAFQQYLKRLKGRGVILAVCSKNDEIYAREVFEKNENMILKMEDISCFVANWDNKPDNIRKIATSLNIGLDAMVFVDDNPAERDLVRTMLPQVEVAPLPEDPANYVPEIEKQRYFEWLKITEEDENRTASYKASEEIEREKQKYSDYDSYLENLEMIVRTENLNSSNIERTVQLFNKTNQFNTTRFRTTESQLLAMQADGNKILSFFLKDKICSYGLIASAVISISEGVCCVDAWCISCRVFKRTLEEYLLNVFTQIALESKCSKICVTYIQNERNALVGQLLQKKGFSAAKDGKGYELNISEKTYFKNKITRGE